MSEATDSQPRGRCCPGGPFKGHRAWCGVLQAQNRPILDAADRALAARGQQSKETEQELSSSETSTPAHEYPSSHTVTEWAVQYAPHAPLTDRPPYMFEVTALWTEETAKAEADRIPGVVVYARERTIYADRLTDWNLVQEQTTLSEAADDFKEDRRG